MSNEMKVGIFFVVGMVILGVLTLYAGGFEDWLKNRYALRAYFNRVDGLQKDDIVTLAGVEVGKVKKIGLFDHRVEVVMLVDGDVVVREDSKARVESESLIGGKYLGITVGSLDARPLEDGEVIQTEEAADVTQTLQEVAEVATDLRTLVRNFNENQENLASQIDGILGENRENIRTSFETLSRIVTENEEGIKESIDALRKAGPQLSEAVESVNKIAKKIESGEGTIGKLVQDDTLYEDMRELSGSLQEASSTVTRILGDNEEDIRETIAALREATPKLKETMERIDTITMKIEKGEGTIGKLVQDDTLYKEATRLFKESRHAAEDVREQVPIITFTSVLFSAFQ